MNKSLLFIHYWKKQISTEELQTWLDKLSLYSFKHWCILLDEKLKRAEL
jgi:arsenate reductase-like glutaredoxin family protein